MYMKTQSSKGSLMLLTQKLAHQKLPIHLFTLLHKIQNHWQQQHTFSCQASVKEVDDEDSRIYPHAGSPKNSNIIFE